MYYIYGLFRYSTKEMFYVGRSRNPSVRYKAHRSVTAKLFKDDFYLEILETTDNPREAESFWIHNALFMGCNIINKELYRNTPVEKPVKEPVYHPIRNRFRFDGLRLKDLRLAKDWTRFDLAAELGVKALSIALWECGNHEPTISTIGNIGKAFGINGMYFIVAV